MMSSYVSGKFDSCFVFSSQRNQICENVFEWICPKYSVTLIINSEFGRLVPKIQNQPHASSPLTERSQKLYIQDSLFFFK